MMKFPILELLKDEDAAAAIEMAFALPIFLMLVWSVFELGQVFRAVAGMQHALGEGARLATIYPTPSDDDIKTRISAEVFGDGPGEFAVADPVIGTGYKDLSVTYTQKTDLLFLKGPTVSLTRSKRVYVAS